VILKYCGKKVTIEFFSIHVSVNNNKSFMVTLCVIFFRCPEHFSKVLRLLNQLMRTVSSCHVELTRTRFLFPYIVHVTLGNYMIAHFLVILFLLFSRSPSISNYLHQSLL